MRFIADFHIHSKYSRATSRQMDLEHLNQWAKIKGLQILGTGDFTHPIWFKELKEKLEPTENGLYRLKSEIRNPKSETPKHDKSATGQANSNPPADGPKSKTSFILTTELSCIYSKGGKARRIHLVVFAPNLKVVEKINQKLGEKYNLRSDGRPILGLDAKELAKILLDISPDIFIVPAHAWTPWYSIFGSKSGFDSIEECFEELTPKIYAIETGLSSSPAMNWRWSYLDKYALISNSDAHSPENIGREANVFDFAIDPDYYKVIEAIKTRKNFLFTIEFFPEEGKYHFDGHRECGLRLTPEETKQQKGICPKCRRPLTVGVMYRVEELADRKESSQPKDAPDYKSLIPLKEILAEIFGSEKKSKKVDQEYHDLVKKAGGEFNVLLNFSETDLSKIASPAIVEAVLKMRKGEVFKEAGYDGVYGKIRIFNQPVLVYKTKQKRLVSDQQPSLF